MKIYDAKNIPLQKLIEALGGRYSHTDRQGDDWYFSPFRAKEATASFKVNKERNTWHDFGHARTVTFFNQKQGGDIIDLWCDYNFKDRRLAIPEALEALERFNSVSDAELRRVRQLQSQPALKPKTPKPPRYKILEFAKSITFSGLKDELNRRKISLKLANFYLKQGQILDTVTKKQYTAFLFENDKGGYEISVPNPSAQQCFKTCIGPKSSTRVLTNSEETDAADVFEGFWDFLSWLEINANQLPKHHSYILNSVSLISEVCDKIIAFKETVKSVFLFLDNDEAGYQATHAMAEKLVAENFEVGSMEQDYKGYKDLSDKRMGRLIMKNIS